MKLENENLKKLNVRIENWIFQIILSYLGEKIRGERTSYCEVWYS